MNWTNGGFSHVIIGPDWRLAGSIGGKHHCVSEPPPHLAVAVALVAGGLLSLIPEQTCIHEKRVKGLGA
jgi:hypothetical protein